MSDFKQTNLPDKPKTLEDYLYVKDGRIILKTVLQTENFIEEKRGVRMRGEGLDSSGGTIQGATIGSEGTMVISGILNHTGTSLGFYNATPVAKQTVTFGNTNGEIGGLTISAGYVQAEVVALRDKCEELADDCRALKLALANLGLMN